ncbi:MAG: SIR2 family NAD-dependent protein deacylase, partial [Aggregatilineales bacterium]
HIAVLTGAGVSKESGIPTFRDAMEGLWAEYDPQELATPIAFMMNPELVWNWYEWRRTLLADKKPNPGHLALAKLQKYKQVSVITQNVDDLHEQAGSTDVIHLHGNIATHKCFANCQGMPTIVDISTLDYEQGTVPKCPYCDANIRPNVVWYGEFLPPEEVKKAKEVSRNCDVMLVIGTSGAVYSATIMIATAQEQGATIIEVNPNDSLVSPMADLKLEAPSGIALPKVMQHFSEENLWTTN